MNDFTLKTIDPGLVPSNYLSVANDARVCRDKQIKTILEKVSAGKISRHLS